MLMSLLALQDPKVNRSYPAFYAVDIQSYMKLTLS